MPQVFKIGSYWVYFWANENEPLEPIRVHVSQGAPTKTATKIWITKAGAAWRAGQKAKVFVQNRPRFGGGEIFGGPGFIFTHALKNSPQGCFLRLCRRAFKSCLAFL